MYARSQAVSIRDIADILLPRGKGQRYIVLFVGYIDESANSKVFTLSCVLTTTMNWKLIESKWKRLLRETNKELRRQGRKQISRYHAADCSSLKGEFDGWSVDEQIAFAKKFIAVIKYGKTTVVAYSMPLDAFTSVYPEHSDNPEKQLYGLLLKFMMWQLMNDIKVQTQGQRLKPYHIALIHDRSSRDGDMLSAFNQVKNDPTFEGREHFTTIAAMGWEDCIPLQAADIIAYETFKDVSNRISPDPRPRRKSLQSLLEPDSLFGGHSLSFDRNSVELLRRTLEDSHLRKLL